MGIEELVYIDENGYFFADYPAFLDWLQTEYRGIYGEDVYLEPDSQDGQLLAVFALALYETAALGAAVYASFSPSSARGVGLSRNVKINGLERRSATYSEVELTIVGVAGTVLSDAQAEDTLGQKWLIPTVTIPISGTVDVTARAENLGAVQASPNTVNKIFTPTLGWQTVNNSAAAVPGVPVETDFELRRRQAISTANPSRTVLEGTEGAVANLSGVTKTKAYENDTDTTDANGIPSHSIEIFALGGDDVEIAQTIALHKTPGTGTFGTTTELVSDSRGMPLNISFSRPVQAIINVEITIATNSFWNPDFEPLIQERVADFINALRVGDAVLLSRLFAPAYLLGDPGNSYDIVLIEISEGADPVGPANVILDYDEYAFCDAETNVTLIVT